MLYLVAANAALKVVDGQRLMDMDRLEDKFTALMVYLTHEKEMLRLGKKIQSKAKKAIRVVHFWKYWIRLKTMPSGITIWMWISI